MNVIVGIDPSLTGLAVCLMGERLHVDRFTSKPAKTLRGRIRRYNILRTSVISMIACARPGLIVIEGYSYGSRQSQANTLGEFGGLLRASLLLLCPVVEVAPSTLKKFATGKGGANKTQVVAAITKRYGVQFDTDDEYDAYGLMQLGRCVAGQIEPVTTAQREAVDVVRKTLAAELEMGGTT
jgi:crossover junction endodeoxyribonuclease RuvC